MKINFKKIINIKNKKELSKFVRNKPIFFNNYLFHYLIQTGNLAGLRLEKVPIYKENNDGLNGFLLAAKEYNFKILSYLISTYPDYIYNKNAKRETFVDYVPVGEFIQLMKTHANLNWFDLLENSPVKALSNILINLNYSNLIRFIKIYPINPGDKHQYLFDIIDNAYMTQNEKIKILNKFSYEQLNAKNELGEGIILTAILNEDDKIVDYLLNANIDVNYYTIRYTHSPLVVATRVDILTNRSVYVKKILPKLYAINPLFFRESNKYMDNIAHSLFYTRINRKNQILSALEIKNQSYAHDFMILKYCDSECWNQLNIDKVTPFELVIKLDIEIYSSHMKNIQISQNILDKIYEMNAKSGQQYSGWIKFLSTLPKYQDVDIVDKTGKPTVNLKINDYSHYTLFQAKFMDVGVYTIYLADTYPNLLIPNITSSPGQLTNLTWSGSFPFSDDIIAKKPIFPWIISYYSPDEYYIHPYLNNIINSTIRDKKKRFGAVFLCISFDSILHANILIYDFDNMIVERFEPDGNRSNSNIDEKLDNMLEEELTWNTGLKYVRPKSYLPWAGFQTISDEKNLLNTKPGDFGGFCLAWCLWFLETKLINSTIDSKTLVEKLIKKMIKLDMKFSEYIRNYSNKINEKRIKYLKLTGMNTKSISNVYLSNEDYQKLTNYLINKFNPHQNNNSI
jgi:hypothetical protein